MAVSSTTQLLLVCSLIFLALFDSTSAARISLRQKAAPLKARQDKVVRDISSTNPQPLDACGKIIKQYNDGTSQFPARDAYDCLKSVPFKAEIARDFLKYYSETLQFHSTISYLRDPPGSYQQPAVDVLEAIAAIEDNIDSGVYVNEYAFEADVQRVAFRMRDSHVTLQAGLLYQFTFGSPMNIVSLSVDGHEFPKPYISTDIIGRDGSFTPSPISHINGQEATAFLKRYAQVNSGSGVEPHADYNALMYNSILDLQAYLTAFGISSPFYTGDLLDIQFANGTALPTMNFQAVANFIDDVSNVKSAEDFYNTFVVLPPPTDDSTTSEDSSASISDSSDSTSASGDSTNDEADSANGGSETMDGSSTDTGEASDGDNEDVNDTKYNNWKTMGGVTSYPQPDVAQPNLGYGGWVTGYFINSTKTGVLSIPSFNMNNEAILTFSYTIGNFTQRAKNAGMKRIVIDLQQNVGGDMLLAIDAFRHFFPKTDFYAGSRTRDTDYIDVLGYTLTKYFEPFLENGQAYNSTYTMALIDDPWAILNIVNPDTGRYYRSWDEFRGPQKDHGNSFTRHQQYNYSNPLFTSSAVTDVEDDSDANSSSDAGETDDETPVMYVPYGYGSAFPGGDPPFAAENIVLLTDTACASTCALFVELMHHVAGVHTVAVGGLPQPGPMQAVGGSRGAQMYTSFDIDSDMAVAGIVNDTAYDLLPKGREDINFTIAQIAINLKDQIRKDEDFPLQFEYAAADCRIFWTAASLNDFSNLWARAAAATWDNPSLCVVDSTGYVRKTTDTVGPSNAHKASWALGQTVAEGEAALAALLNQTVNSKPMSQSTNLGDWIFGGIGGSIEDFNGNRHASTQQPSNNGCETNGCSRGSRCSFTANCNSNNGAFELTKQSSCKVACQFPNPQCPSGSYCNNYDLSCDGLSGNCSPLKQNFGFCEALSTQGNAKACSSNALLSIRRTINQKNLPVGVVVNGVRTTGN